MLGYVSLAFNIYRFVEIHNIIDRLNKKEEFISFEKISYFDDISVKINAITLFLVYMKIFKYVSLNKRLTHLRETLIKSATALSSFMVLFLIFFIAYASFAYLMFGHNLPKFRSFSQTFFTLFRIMVGDTGFKVLRKNFSISGPIFFISFVFLCKFVLFNMFMAIINDSYTGVKKDAKNDKYVFMFSDFLMLHYSRIVSKLLIKKNRIFDIEDVVYSREAFNVNSIDFKTWRNSFKVNLFMIFLINQIYKFYFQGERLL